MGGFFHILLCCAAAIGGYFGVGLTTKPASIRAEAVQGTRYVASGLMAVPMVRGGKMRGFLFLKTGLAVDDTLALPDDALAALVADAAYQTLMPEPSNRQGAPGLPDLQQLDLDKLRRALSSSVNAAVHKPVVQNVLITQLDMRADIHLRRPTLRAVIDQ